MKICRVDGCENEAGVRGSAKNGGLCRAHYHRWQRYGTEMEPSRRVVSFKGDLCSEIGCERTVEAHGLCTTHYAVAQRRSNPEGNRRRLAAFRARQLTKQEDAMGRPRPLHCEMCGDLPGGRGSKPTAGICFDHDHATGQPRGWLCDRCNKVLGLVKDDPHLLRKMASYVTFGGIITPFRRSA